MRALKRIATAALMLALVCLTTAGARQQSNPNSLGAGNGTSPDKPAGADKAGGKSASKSAQKSKTERGANEQGPGGANEQGPGSAPRPNPPRRGHHN
jgi:hypothetical protein